MESNYVSLGFQCTVPTVLNKKEIKGPTLPFDWMLSSPKFVYKMIYLLLDDMPVDTLVRDHFFKCDYKSQILRENDDYVLEHYITNINGNALLNRKYNVIFPHDSYDEFTIQKYIRRFERLKKIILEGKNVTYLYISPSSKESGDFSIDGKIIIEDYILYLNKIYNLIKSKSNFFNFKVLLTNNNDIENLVSGIEYINISPKSVWMEIVDECKNKL